MQGTGGSSPHRRQDSGGKRNRKGKLCGGYCKFNQRIRTVCCHIKGICIPHTRAEDGSLGIGFSLITLREPVYFDPKDDPVEVMICFSAIDSQTHLDILKMIVTFVEKGYVEKIAKLDTIDELNALLQNEE